MQQFVKQTKRKKFICFGASKMPQEMCEWYSDYHLENQIEFVVDNDSKKWGKNIRLGKRDITIRGVDYLVKNHTEGLDILVTSRYYYEIVEQLDSMSELDQVHCYIFPLFELEKHEFQIEERTADLIPRIIHYCWFGGGEKPLLNQKCIDSWKKHCPEYTIMEWTPDNCDMHINEYVEEAFFKCKQFGACADYFSVKRLYEYGGIYMDIDVELLQNIDVFLSNKAFASFDSTNGMINFGSGAGCAPKHPIMNHIREEYEDIHFLNGDGSRNDAANYVYQTMVLKEYGLKLDNSMQLLGDITIYPSECFCPYDMRTGITQITKNTYGIHHFNGSWWDEERTRVFKRQQMEATTLLKRMCKDARND